METEQTGGWGAARPRASVNKDQTSPRSPASPAAWTRKRPSDAEDSALRTPDSPRSTSEGLRVEMSKLLLVNADDTLRPHGRTISRRDDPSPGIQTSYSMPNLNMSSPRAVLSPRSVSSERVGSGERKFSLGSQREAEMLRSKQDLPPATTSGTPAEAEKPPCRTRFPKSEPVADSAYIALKAILLEPSFKVVLAACDALAELEDFDKFLTAVVRLFHANGRILWLVRLMVAREVMYTLDPTTLFRQDSIATKVLSAYAKEVGLDYLRACLLGPMKRLCQHAMFTPEALEIDPTKLAEGVSAEANAENLQVVVTDFMNSIYAQTDECPPCFREIAWFLQEQVGSKFPSSRTQAVAGFLFLRFLCPAILNPKGYGIMEETPNRPEFRALILVSKLVQQMANGARPIKQDFMQVMDGYIVDKLGEVSDFLNSYGVKFELNDSDNEKASPTVTPVEKEALDVLQKIMKFNIHKIGRVIVTSNEQRKSWRKNVADTAEMQGYLKKKGEISVTSPWRTRWFVLKNRFLYYFKSPQHSTSAGAIPLGKCTVRIVEQPEARDKEAQEFCFEIVTNYRTYCLMAATEKERNKWMAAIEAQIKSAGSVVLAPTQQPSVLATAGSAIVTAKKGYLIKRGNMVKNWKKRWFVLKDHLLFYYKSHTDPSPKGEVPIQHCFVRRSALKDAETPYVFELTVAERTFVFCAPDEETVKAWMDAIKRSKNEWWKTEQDRKGKYLERKPAGLRETTSPSARAKLTDEETAKRALIKPEREGFLVKQGASVRTWKRQWCVVSEGRLYYFKTPNDDTAAGYVALEDSAVERSAVGGFCLEIVTRERRHFFRATDREDMEAWIAAIRHSAAIRVESGPEKGLAPPAEGSTRKVGWLMKMGVKVNSTWCRRWIIIHDNLLSYYRTPQDEDPNGVIPLENSSIRFVEGKQGSFEIFTQYRKYFFMARNEIEASEWIEAIQQARVSASTTTTGAEPEQNAMIASFRHLHEALEMFGSDGSSIAMPKGSLIRPLSLSSIVDRSAS